MPFVATSEVIEDSVFNGQRLTTLQLRYPRMVHSEFMTHRVLSRNASSSRAIPVSKMLSQVWNNPAEPYHWGANQPGMQANTQLEGVKLWLAKKLWRGAAKVACAFVWAIDKLGGHKQWANRLLEPWQFIHVIVTATDWDNFFELRTHKDAQPEFQQLALAIQKSLAESTPRRMTADDLASPYNWHLPYISWEERSKLPLDELLKCSAARCARVSYLTHDGKTPDVQKDVTLFDRLITAKPMHASPIEHQAIGAAAEFDLQSSNLRGWHQLRKMVERHPDFFEAFPKAQDGNVSP